MHVKTIQKIQEVLDFGSDLLARIRRSSSLDDIPSKDCADRLTLFPLSRTACSVDQRKSLDKQGTALWNLCRHPTVDEPESMAKVRCYVRVFAFCMVEAAQPQGEENITESTRILQVALRTSKDCLAHGQLGLASKVLERAAKYQRALSCPESRSQKPQDMELAHLTVSYIMQRIGLAWKQNRTDLANHFFEQLDVDYVKQDIPAAEALTDLLLNVGRGLFESQMYDDAETWLSRGYEIIQQLDIGLMSLDANELRLCLMHTYVRALLMQENGDAGKTALSVFANLHRDYGGKLSVQLLNLEILSHDTGSDGQKFFAGLMTMIRSIHLTDINLQKVFHQVHRLRSMNLNLALEIVHQMLIDRLIPAGANKWIEKCVLMLVWIGGSLPTDPDLVVKLNSVLTEVQLSWNKALSPVTSEAALLVIWKVVDQHFSHKRYIMAIEWGQIALHRLLSGAGQTNIAKIERRILLCHYHTTNLQDAKDLFQQLSEAGRRSPLTRYLMFKIAVSSEDDVLAMEVFESLCHSEDSDSEYLTACVSEILRAGRKSRVRDVLLKLLDKYNYTPPININSLALLRCAVRLLVPDLVPEAPSTVIESVCRLFDSAASLAQASAHVLVDAGQDRSASKSFIPQQNEWFAKTCYNVLVRCYSSWHFEDTLKLYAAFEKFLEAFNRTDTDNMTPSPTSLVLRSISFNCDFIISVLHVKEARAESDASRKLQHYIESSSPIKKIHSRFFDPTAGYDHGKYHTILTLDFERAVFQEEAAHLSFLVNQASKTEAPFAIYATYVDCILASTTMHDRPLHATTTSSPDSSLTKELAVDLLCRVITILRDNSTYDIIQASRWIRCLTQFILSASSHPVSSRINIVLKTLSAQAVALARDSRTAYDDDHVSCSLPSPDQLLHNTTKETIDDPMSSSSLLYPTEELEWLATTLFNHAIDLYVDGRNDGEAKSWAERSLELADVLIEIEQVLAKEGEGGHSEGGGGGGGGTLVKLLRERMRRLGWS